MSGLARLLTRSFFRQVEVEHGERIVSGRPTVVVADHRNGLVDGLLLMGALHRYPRFLGKSTLFHNPLLWPFLQLGGVVPVYRAQDGGSPEGNRRAFARCHRLLARGGMVAVFPEGVSHDEPALQPLRTGAARIALSAAAAGVADVETVAVTLVYDDKQRFRSRALVRVGVPVPVQPWIGAYRDDGPAAVRALTHDLAERLRPDGSEYASWIEATLLAEIADVVARSTTVLPEPVDLADRSRVVDALVRARRTPGSTTAAAMRSLEAAHAAYREALDVLGLDDAQVAADYRSGRLRWDLAGAQALVVVALPPALVGVVVHAVPYGVVKAGQPGAGQRGDAGHGQGTGELRLLRPDLPGRGAHGGPRFRGRLGSGGRRRGTGVRVRGRPDAWSGSTGWAGPSPATGPCGPAARPPSWSGPAGPRWSTRPDRSWAPGWLPVLDGTMAP